MPETIVEKLDFNKALNLALDSCESCHERPKRKNGKWCQRCIDRYERSLKTNFEIQSAILRAIPADYLSAELSDFAELLKSKLQNWNRKDNLFFYGDTGTGKTRAIFALIKSLIAKGYSVNRCEFTALTSAIRDTFNNKSNVDSENKIVGRFADIDVLFLDDLGLSSKASDFDYEILYRIIDARLMSLLPTIIASNKTKDEIGLLFDVRIASRLHKFEVIKFDGEDMRLKQRAVENRKVKK